jgi:MarR family transcriptional regulator, transcriptional regulator for hemolysin
VPHPTGKSSFDTYKAGETTREIRMLISMVLVVRGFRNRLEEELRKIDQTAARMETLSAILNMPGDKSQTDVARRLRIEGATVTRMIDILAKEGLVERRSHPTDRRVNLLEITPAGEREVKRIFTVYDVLRTHLLQDISAEEISLMQGLVDRMMVRLDEPLDTSLSIADMIEVDRLRDTLSAKKD